MKLCLVFFQDTLNKQEFLNVIKEILQNIEMAKASYFILNHVNTNIILF